ADDGQNKASTFGPNRSFGCVKPEQAMEIESPGMNVWRLTSGPAEPGFIGADRVEQPAGVGEEGSEQGHRYNQRDTESGGKMPKIEAWRQYRRSSGVEQPIPELIEAERQRGRRHCDDESLFCGGHQAKPCPSQ